MEYVKLSEITEVITKGTTPTSIGYNFCDEGINFIKIESINADGKVLNDKVGYISEECHNKLKRSQLKENDILFSIAGAIGRTCIITKDILPANTNQALAIIRLKENDYDIEYLNILLNSQFITKQYNKRKQGVAQLNLSLTDIGNLEIPKLNITEQLNIKNKLKRINKMILIKKQEINKCIDLIKSQFVEMFENKKFDISLIKDIAEVVTKGTTPSSVGYQFDENGIINFIKVESIDNNGNFIKEKMAHISEKCNEKLKRSKLSKNDILFSIAGAIGRTAVVTEEILPANTNQALAIIRINSDKVDIKFLNYMLNSDYVIKQYNKKKQGVAQINLSLNDISNLKILIPPIELQNKFAQIVGQIDKQKFEFEKSLKKLEELQAALMQEYFR